MKILSNKTYNEMVDTIERQHNRIVDMARAHVDELEDQNGKYNTLKTTHDSMVKGAAKQIEDLNNKIEDYKNQLHEAKESIERKDADIAKLKEQLDARTEEVKELEEKVKKNASQIVATTTLYEAGVMEMAKFMRTTPAYKSKKKDEVQHIADDIICKKAKKLIEERTTVKQKENKENKEI